MVDRAARVARELGLNFHLVSSGQEWRRPDLARASGAAFIVPLNFSAAPKLSEEDDWTQVSLDQLRAWDWAAENPAVLPDTSCLPVHRGGATRRRQRGALTSAPGRRYI